MTDICGRCLRNMQVIMSFASFWMPKTGATNSIRLVPLCAGLINARLLGPPAWMLAGRAKPLGTRLIAALRP